MPQVGKGQPAVFRAFPEMRCGWKRKNVHQCEANSPDAH